MRPVATSAGSWLQTVYSLRTQTVYSLLTKSGHRDARDPPRRKDYVYLVPLVEDEHTVFLKTIIPSRKATKDDLGEESDHED